MGKYVVGRALTSAIPVFIGDGTADCDIYLHTLERLKAMKSRLPLVQRLTGNELFIKLEDLANGWYVHTFPDPDTFPPWSQVTLGLPFGQHYAAADSWANKCTATRQEGESGPAALQRLDELQQTLLLLGVPVTIGPVEQQCYQLQRLLTSDETRVWSAAANALLDVSDDAFRAQETAAAAATLTSTGRQSLSLPVSVDERDLWFEPRLGHLLTFLKDQPGHQPAGGRQWPDTNHWQPGKLLSPQMQRLHLSSRPQERLAPLPQCRMGLIMGALQRPGVSPLGRTERRQNSD